MIFKLNHFAATISTESEILIEPFKSTNDYDGFYLLLSKLAPLNQNSIIIGLESTAHYSDNLIHFLITKDFKVYVLDPLSTSSMRKNNMRRTKIDKVDTFVVAKTLMLQDSLKFITLKNLGCIELKKLGSSRQKNVNQHTCFKIQMTHLAHFLQKNSSGHLGKDTVRKLRVLAQKSVGINDSSFSIQIT